MFINLICSIPDSIGWAMVGFLGALALVMGIKVTKMLIQMWREWHEDEEEIEIS